MHRSRAGFTIIELMITLAVLGVVIMIGLPSMSAWIQNTQIRTAAEGVVSGLQIARAEALRRNLNVRFQLVDTLGAGCVVSATGSSWVVSLDDATNLCHVAALVAPPEILQKKSAAEGASNATVTADAPAAVFNGLGRLAGVGNLTRILVGNTNGECIVPGGNQPMRCLRILVSTGGGVRMCDPAVTDVADPRCCWSENPLCQAPAP